MKRNDTVFVESPICFCDCGLVHIIVSRENGLMSMTLSQPKMLRQLFTNSARQLLLTAPNSEEILEMTDAVYLMDLSEGAK